MTTDEKPTCVDCGRTEPGTTERPVTLISCPACPGLRCASPCYSLHREPGDAPEVGSLRWTWLRRFGRRAA